MTINITIAETPAQFEAAGRLFRAYGEYLGLDLEFQGFSEELVSLPEMYGPPHGALLLASLSGEPVGAVGLRQFEPGVAEMKRMYVLESCHGMGIGSALTEAFLERARMLGYRSVRLDSIAELASALRLYRRIGFREIEPYRFNPHPDAVFMEYVL